MSGILCHRAPPRCVSGQSQKEMHVIGPFVLRLRQYLAHPPDLFPLWQRESAPKAAPIATSHSSRPAQKSSTPTTPGDAPRPTQKSIEAPPKKMAPRWPNLISFKFSNDNPTQIDVSSSDGGCWRGWTWLLLGWTLCQFYQVAALAGGRVILWQFNIHRWLCRRYGHVCLAVAQTWWMNETLPRTRHPPKFLFSKCTQSAHYSSLKLSLKRQFTLRCRRLLHFIQIVRSCPCHQTIQL